jgi:Na+-transporting methylmalonyl-CoA/oxaloacetate decarboxylase gamma subunit
MIEWLGSVLSTLRQTSPIIFFGISLASGILVFAGHDIADTMGLADFRQQYRVEIGLAFVFSVSIFFAQTLWGTGRLIRAFGKRSLEARKAKRALEEKRKQLHDLTPDEKAYLQPYIKQEENTQYFAIVDGIAGGLEAKGIIYRSSNVGNFLSGTAYNMQPWAREYLRENPDLLKGASTEPRRPRLR